MQQGGGNCSSEVAIAAVASRMASKAVSREVASAVGRWQVQYGGGKCGREVEIAEVASRIASAAEIWQVQMSRKVQIEMAS